MPFVKKEVFDAMKDRAMTDLKAAQWKLCENRVNIKRLAEDQMRLKQKVKLCAQLVAEFEKRKEQS